MSDSMNAPLTVKLAPMIGGVLLLLLGILLASLEAHGRGELAAVLFMYASALTVQTTRLVLFEFFIRFLRAEGRIFKPLRGLTAGRG